MKTKIRGSIRKIKAAVNELQHYSFNEFQQLLPLYLKYPNQVNYDDVEQYFINETGISIKDYFYQVKAEKAKELLNHYRLSPIEVAYQLGFRTISSLRKIVRLRNDYSTAQMQFSGMN